MCSAFGGFDVERQHGLIAAALQRPRAIAFVRQEMADRGAQERAETAARRSADWK
jgi:hypothetical protein